VIVEFHHPAWDEAGSVLQRYYAEGYALVDELCVVRGAVVDGEYGCGLLE
jgi:hypothetical protein